MFGLIQVQCLLLNIIIHLKTKKNLKRIIFHAEFICEGIDQTRGWFYTLHAIATMLFDNVAFKNVIVNELILGQNRKENVQINRQHS